MKSKFNKYLLSFGLMCVGAKVFAQPPPPPGLPPVPVDNWVSFFIVVAVGYAIYILKFKAKKSI